MVGSLYQQLFGGSDLSSAIWRSRQELYNRKERCAYFNQRIQLGGWLPPGPCFDMRAVRVGGHQLISVGNSPSLRTDLFLLLKYDSCKVGTFRRGARRDGLRAHPIYVTPTTLLVDDVSVRGRGWITGYDFFNQIVITVNLNRG